MSKRTRHHFPGDTPVSQRRLTEAKALDTFVKPRNTRMCAWHDCHEDHSPDHPLCQTHLTLAIERDQARDQLCVWPACDERRTHDYPLCYEHIDKVHQFAKDLRWDETREEAISRTRRGDAAAKRSNRAWDREDRLLDSRGTKPGWIYYLRIDGKVKIGYTTNIVRRMRSYPPSSPLLGVHPGTPSLERELHEQFKGSLVQGREWFRPDPDLLAHCEQVRAEYGDPSRFEYRARNPYETKQVTAVKSWRGKLTA